MMVAIAVLTWISMAASAAVSSCCTNAVPLISRANASSTDSMISSNSSSLNAHVLFTSPLKFKFEEDNDEEEEGAKDELDAGVLLLGFVDAELAPANDM